MLSVSNQNTSNLSNLFQNLLWQLVIPQQVRELKVASSKVLRMRGLTKSRCRCTMAVPLLTRIVTSLLRLALGTQETALWYQVLVTQASSLIYNNPRSYWVRAYMAVTHWRNILRCLRGQLMEPHMLYQSLSPTLNNSERLRITLLIYKQEQNYNKPNFHFLII